MNFKSVLAILLFVMFAVLLRCAAQQKPVTEPPAFPEGVADARWGMQVKEVKEAVETFQDDTGKPPFALYAWRKHFDLPAIVSYFFTPKSKKLYRTDVTFNDPGVYGTGKGKSQAVLLEDDLPDSMTGMCPLTPPFRAAPSVMNILSKRMSNTREKM